MYGYSSNYKYGSAAALGYPGSGGSVNFAAGFLTATGITDPTITAAIEQLVVDLQAANIWDKFIALYPFVGGTADTHKYNLKDPRDLNVAFRLTFHGTVTHNANGITPNGVDGYANTYLVPATELAEASSHAAVYSRTSTDGTGIELGAGNASNTRTMALSIRFFDLTRFYSYAYLGTTRVSTASADGSGFFVGTRISNTDSRAFRNGSQVGSTATGSPLGQLAEVIDALLIGADNHGGGTPTEFSARNLAFVSVGLGLSIAEVSAFNTIVQAFQVSLARQV